MKRTILVIEDEALQLRTLTGFLKKQGYLVIWSTSGVEGLRMAQKQPVDLILTDYKMPGKNGLEVLKEAKAVNPEIAVVLVTAHGTEEIAVQAMKEGAFDYVTKPVDLDELEIVVKKALEQKQLVSENRELRRQLAERYHFHEIISGSAEMEEVINTAGRAARSKATVLIQGESGTGKELIARAIHYASSRKDAPFVAVNCAALSENLLESELFGHERGAFTGADAQRKGRFEQADGGTLFIDEVGDISVGAQVKLLRVLQEQQFERVGGNETIQVDVRVIAATNQNLEEMMRQGSFREDLFYRLNVISIPIPPLRERKDDIPPLISHFIHKYAGENDKEIEEVSKEAMDVLIRYDYPGNVRELGNAIERAVVMARGTLVASEDLPIHLRSPQSERESSYESRGRSLTETLEDLERHLITDALAKTDGNQSKAAEELGISERNLRYRIKKYGIKT
jgi:two-component system NtrC family response regulator